MSEQLCVMAKEPGLISHSPHDFRNIISSYDSAIEFRNNPKISQLDYTIEISQADFSSDLATPLYSQHQSIKTGRLTA